MVRATQGSGIRAPQNSGPWHAAACGPYVSAYAESDDHFDMLTILLARPCVARLSPIKTSRQSAP